MKGPEVEDAFSGYFSTERRGARAAGYFEPGSQSPLDRLRMVIAAPGLARDCSCVSRKKALTMRCFRGAPGNRLIGICRRAKPPWLIVAMWRATASPLGLPDERELRCAMAIYLAPSLHLLQLKLAGEPGKRASGVLDAGFRPIGGARSTTTGFCDARRRQFAAPDFARPILQRSAWVVISATGLSCWSAVRIEIPLRTGSKGELCFRGHVTCRPSASVGWGSSAVL